MPVVSGAGAAVASGAGYQSRVAAYFIVCCLTDLRIPFLSYGKPRRLSLETAEAVDDLQVEFESGHRIVAQAKRRLSFSTQPGSEFVSVIDQFVRHHVETGGNNRDTYCLITTSEASKRVTGDMSAALNAARDCTYREFKRDQPQSITSTFDSLVRIAIDLRAEDDGVGLEQWAHELLAKVRVVVLDIDPNSSLEQALILALHSKGYTAPSEMFGKLSSDCIEWARTRSTIDLSTISDRYTHLLPARGNPTDSSKARQTYLAVSMTAEGMEVGRELVIGRALSDFPPLMKKDNIYVIECYRFDDDCRPRLQFKSDRVIFGNGSQLELWGRFSTWAGTERFLDENLDRFQSDEVVFIPMNREDDLENNFCAKVHREALNATAASRDGLKCVHCDLPISSSMSPIVEFGEGSELVFGLSHRQCVRASDRVLGRADSQLFQENPELVNFDVNAWFNAAHSGHGVFFGITSSSQPIVTLGWGGLPPRENYQGRYVVVSTVETGSEYLACHRGLVQRFYEGHALEFEQKLRGWIDQASTAGDPLCYSDQSRSFGNRSTLLSQIGGREKVLKITDVSVRLFDAREAAPYQRIGQWYAPLMILREAETRNLVCLTNAIPAISDPLALGRHLENWKNAGFDIPKYEIEVLLTDDDVDQLIAGSIGTGFGVILDPVLSEDGNADLLRGYPIYSIDQLREHDTNP